MQRQATFGLIAYEAIKNSLQLMKQGGNHELDTFWYSVQSFIFSGRSEHFKNPLSVGSLQFHIIKGSRH